MARFILKFLLLLFTLGVTQQPFRACDKPHSSSHADMDLVVHQGESEKPFDDDFGCGNMECQSGCQRCAWTSIDLPALELLPMLRQRAVLDSFAPPSSQGFQFTRTLLDPPRFT